MRRFLATGAAVVSMVVLQATPALACGGLVAPDGDVRLDRATTFVAWHDGVERYVTSFAYQGTSADVGWIVPLPTVPTSIEAAGRWTLQRLEREFNPPPRIAFDEALSASAAGSIVVEQLQVEALDITVLKGSGQAVIDWCVHNGFLLPQETKQHLLQYAKASPVFMAAKYDTSVARQRGQNAGDGVPLLITMNTSQLWVPLEVLADDNTQVVADLFLLTDSALSTTNAPLFFGGLFGGGDNVDGAAGFTLVRQEAMSSALRQDLSGDRNMGWVPETGNLAYLTLNTPSDNVTYDLAVGSDSVVRLAAFGTTPEQAAHPSSSETNLHTAAIVLAITLPGLMALGGLVVFRFRRRAA